MKKLRKLIGIVLFLLAGALFALLLFIIRWRSFPTEYSMTQLIGFVIGLLIALIALTIIYFDEVKKHKDGNN